MIETTNVRGAWPPATGGVAVRVRDAAGVEYWTTAPQLSDLTLTKPTDFAWGRLIANRLALPGLRGLWNMHAGYAGSGTTQQVIDLSGQGHHLTINGNPTFGVQQATGLPEVPYIDLDGTGDYLSYTRVASGWTTITGAVTLMGWINMDDATPASVVVLGGHYLTTGNQRSFALLNQAGGSLTAIISSDGTATFTADTAPTVISNATWYHVVLRYIPSTELSIFLNGVETLNTTSIPAAIHDSTGDFNIGSQSAGGLITAGLYALWSVAAAAWTDEAIAACYAQERALFGV